VYNLSNIAKAENEVVLTTALPQVQSDTFCFDVAASGFRSWQSLYWRWRS